MKVEARSRIELGKRLGIENARPHRFRCTFAVNALRRGASIIQTAAWLGDKPETISALPTSEAMSEETRRLLDSEICEGMEPVFLS